MVGNSSAQDGHLDLTNKQSDFTINCDADAMNNGYRCVKIGMLQISPKLPFS
jgi:hypothetical protein